MNKFLLVNIFSFMCILFGYAHDTDKAYFDIVTKGNNTVVHSDFPWTIRNALIAYDTNFNKAKTEEEINAIFFNYAKDKLKLYKANGEELSLLEVILEKDNTHNHATKYTLIYKGTEVEKVYNVIMLDLMKSQKNYNWYTDYKGEKIEFITSKLSPSFNIKVKNNDKMYMYYAFIIGFITLIVILYFLRKKSSPTL